MKRGNIDEQVDATIAERRNALSFVSAKAPVWFTSFEQNLPFRLPPAYRSLLLRYRFRAFQAGTARLFGNLDGLSDDDLVVASIRDRSSSPSHTPAVLFRSVVPKQGAMTRSASI
jgi:hypothetical protein